MNQGSQTRSFAYSSLARLLSTTNPESGSISYQYDNSGNLTQKTDARSITATYAYDSLNLAEILAATSGNDASFNRGKIVNDYSAQCSGFGCNGSDNNGNLRKQTVSVPNNEQNTSPTSWLAIRLRQLEPSDTGA